MKLFMEEEGGGGENFVLYLNAKRSNELAMMSCAQFTSKISRDFPHLEGTLLSLFEVFPISPEDCSPRIADGEAMQALGKFNE